MLRTRQQSTTTRPVILYMVLSSDHVTPATGKTVSVSISKNGAAFGAASGAVSELANGFYAWAGNATDRDTLGELAIRATATDCDASPMVLNIVPYDPYDGTRLGLTALPNAAAEAAGGLITLGTNTGQLNVASGKAPATLATADVTGNLPADMFALVGTALTVSANLAPSFSSMYNISSGNRRFNISSYNQTGDVYAVVNDGTSGNAALLAAIQNIQNNTFIATSIPHTLERPDSGSVTVSIAIVFSDETGTAKNLDSGDPIIALVDDAGNDLSGRLGSFTNPATGKYLVPYTSSSTDDLEGLHWDITGTINSKLRRMVAYMQIVDTTAVDFTSSDRSTLNSLVTLIGDVPTNSELSNALDPIPTAVENADALLVRSATQVEGSTGVASLGRLLLQNRYGKRAATDGVFTIYASDKTTVIETYAQDTNSAAEPAVEAG